MINTIKAEELKKKLESGEDFILINVLNEDSFENEHIPGSINIPFTEISKHKDVLEVDKEIVVYCSDEECEASPIAAKKLSNLGFNNVVDFEGGLEEWKEKGYRTISRGE